MKEVTGRLWIVPAALLAIALSTVASQADISSRCAVSNDPRLVTDFRIAYKEFTGGTELDDIPVNVLDCGYILIFETPLPQGHFGRSTAYIFRKDGFTLMSAIMFD